MQLRNSFYYPGTPGNEMGESDPTFTSKYSDDLARDKGKWIDHSVWHGKPHTWEKIRWLIGEVSHRPLILNVSSSLTACRQWKRISNGRPFVLKGIQNVEDALKAYEVGCEGIVVTNHAGRQVDGAVGSLDVLPEIVAAVGDGACPCTLSPPWGSACADAHPQR